MVIVSNLVDSLKSISADAEQIFGSLSSGQLNWKANPESWSVAQCFDHLIKINSTYFETFERIAAGKHEASNWEKISPLSGLFGKLLIKKLSPESPGKLKAPAIARPASSDLGGDIISKFVGHQADLIKRIESIPTGVNLEKLIITSPLAGFVTYSMADALKIINVHERRHFQQAERVLQSEGFPNG